LEFSGPAPQPPEIPGMLESFRTAHELSITFANYNEATHHALEGLMPDHMEEVSLSLEDAFIAYLGERGEKSFFLEPSVAA
jgi:ABC-2 type transport system ATP-binding protein